MIYQNKTDEMFFKLSDKIQASGKVELVDGMKNGLINWKKSVPPEIYANFLSFNKSLNFWGRIDPDADEYEIFYARAGVLKNNIADIEWVYKALCDYRSKGFLTSLIQYWISMDPRPVIRTRESQYYDYFDLDIMPCSPNEVFVDLGAFVGDTAMDYIRSYGKENYRRIYCYDIVNDNIAAMKKNLKELRDVIIRPCGVGAVNGEMFIQNDVYRTNLSRRIGESGKIKVPVVTLDSDISEQITFLKMDIEGAEYDAILGARQHITRDMPKMAICIYHSNDDLWRIARLVNSIAPGYRFYMRYNGKDNHFIADYVLLCVPPAKNNR